jgi:hypothetical protein
MAMWCVSSITNPDKKSALGFTYYLAIQLFIIEFKDRFILLLKSFL